MAGARVVVYTTRISPMFAAFARAWQARGFEPASVVVEAGPRSWRRLLSPLRRRGDDDSSAMCRRLRWRCVRVTAINDPASVSRVRAVAPDLAINAGAGILRKPILDIPRLGTLGAHMGLLPEYRGMNVAEWAALNGDPVGCSVLWIDEGIDTGAIAGTERVEIGGCRSVEDLRARVNEAQIALLVATSTALMRDSSHAPARRQISNDGRQFYRMHADLRAVLERRLASRNKPLVVAPGLQR
jgi:methionyl-tRNA formyltransferase